MALTVIMQGRLLPPEPGHFQAFPRLRWQEEFQLAKTAQIDAIEWIYDVHGEDVNPIATDEGIRLMQQLSADSGVQVVSLCADAFTAANLPWLLERCRLAGIQRIVLPFVDATRIQSHEHARQVIAMLREVLPTTSVEVHLEADLAPEAFTALVDALPFSHLKVTYDSGNSASLGYNVAEEFAAYGERISSVHIKDRVRGGGTVPLGTGDADFDALFSELKRVHYCGDFVLQTARETAGEELLLAKRNLSWLKYVASGL